MNRKAILPFLGAVVLLAIALYLLVPQVRATHELRHGFRVSGIGSHYACTAGWCDGTPTVALPAALGGRYNGRVHGWVQVCSTRCARIAVVDYCQCYWGTADQRVVDLNDAAWKLVTDEPYGLIRVSVRSVEPGGIEAIPNTATGYSAQLRGQYLGKLLSLWDAGI